MKNILVALDFDDEQGLLISKASLLAKPLGAKIWILHVAEPDPAFVGYNVGPQYIRDARAKDLRDEHRLLQRYAAELEAEGIEAESLLMQGMTTEMIMKEVVKLDIDLLITGHHDRSFIYKAMVGSISSQIIKKAKIPVLIVPID